MDSTPGGGPGRRNTRTRSRHGIIAGWRRAWPTDTQLRLPYPSGSRAGGAAVSVPGVSAAVVFVRQRRARHYILRLRDDGVVRVTVPWHGSRAEAERFLVSRREWVDRERHRRQLAQAATQVAPEVRARLRAQAARELPARLLELARVHGFAVAGRKHQKPAHALGIVLGVGADLAQLAAHPAAAGGVRLRAAPRVDAPAPPQPLGALLA